MGVALCDLALLRRSGRRSSSGRSARQQASSPSLLLCSAWRGPQAQCLGSVNFVAGRFKSCSSPRHHCHCAEKAAWEAAHALREVHIPPVVLNPDCSLGLAEPDQQLPKDADAATGDWEQQQRQQQQQQVAQQQGQRQAARQQSQRSQRTTLGRPSGGVELQQLPPTVLHSAPQQPGVCGFCWLPLDCCQLPMRLSILHPAADKRRSHLAARSACSDSLLLPPCLPAPAGGQAWPGATVYVRGSRAAFASASIQAPLV